MRFHLLLCLLSVKSSLSITPARNLEADDVSIEDFSNPQLQWQIRNDPVMGGQSTAVFTINKEESVGIFDGQVEIVPFLKAPGFIKLEASSKTTFPDVSSCNAVKLVVKSTTSDYKGYRPSFGTKHDPATHMPFIGGFKAHFFLEPHEDFQSVVIPFNNFTLDWDPATGDPLETCEQKSEYCPDMETLRDMKKFSIMGEGVKGHVHLEIQSITATGCKNANDDPLLTSKEVILMEDFSSPKHSWKSLNDPVMGGKSHGTAIIENGVGIFDGEVVDVPFLHAPGFIQMLTNDKMPYPDASSCRGLQIVLKTQPGDTYEGYRFSFGTIHLPDGRHATGYKAPALKLKGSGEWETVVLPFDTFSAKWDERTGDILTSCKMNRQFCPTAEALTNLKSMAIWGEGVAGKVHLEIQSIAAFGCAASSSIESNSSSMADKNDTEAEPTTSGRRLTVYGGLIFLIVAWLFVKRQQERTKELVYQSVLGSEDTTEATRYELELA